MRLRFGAFVLDEDRFRLERDGESVALRPKVFDLLVLLVRERERVVLREELVMRLWSSTTVGSGSLSGLVNELRVALGEDGRGPSSIRTVHARGYQFVASVAVEGAPEASLRGASGIDEATWLRTRAELGRAGARAWVAVLSERPARRAWLAQAMREAGQAGFEVRAAIGGGDGPTPLDAAPTDALALEGAGDRDAGRAPIALAFEVEDASAWSRAGGPTRLLDLLGRARVLVLAAVADLRWTDATDGTEGGACALEDPRIEVVALGSDAAPVGPVGRAEAGATDRVRAGLDGVRGRVGDGAGEGLGGMIEMLRVLARSDTIGFVAALRTMGFEPAPTEPIRALRRVGPGRGGPGGRRDAGAG